MNKPENNGNVKVRFNVIDAIILLLIVLCIAGVAFRYSIMDRLGFGQETGNYQVNFSISSVSYTMPGLLHDGDKLYYGDGTVAGELMSVAEFSKQTTLTSSSDTIISKPASIYVSNDGELVYVSYPDYTLIDGEGAFMCNGTYGTDGYFCVGGARYLAVGQSVTLYTDTVTLNMTVTGIKAAG